MNKDFDYNLLPYKFAHCMNGQCKQADKCLRSRAAQHIPIERKTVTFVNPAHTNPANEDCPYFKADQLQQFALGMTHLLAYIYRLWRKERLFSPEQQEYVRQLFLERGLQEAPVFDEYVEQYEW